MNRSGAHLVSPSVLPSCLVLVRSVPGTPYLFLPCSLSQSSLQRRGLEKSLSSYASKDWKKFSVPHRRKIGLVSTIVSYWRAIRLVRANRISARSLKIIILYLPSICENWTVRFGALIVILSCHTRYLIKISYHIQSFLECTIIK